MDDKSTLALERWMRERTVRKNSGLGRPRSIPVQLTDLTEINVRQCQNRMYYSAQLHRYVGLRELFSCFDRGIPVKILTKEGVDTTVPTLLKALAERVRCGELQITHAQLRGLAGAR